MAQILISRTQPDGSCPRDLLGHFSNRTPTKSALALGLLKRDCRDRSTKYSQSSVTENSEKFCRSYAFSLYSLCSEMYRPPSLSASLFRIG